MSRRLTIWRAGSLALCALAWLPSPGAAQTMEAPPPLSETSLTCPPQNVPHVPGALLRSLVTEWALLKQDWCKLVKWDDTWPRLQYLMVDLFTGPGLHPTAGIVVPDGGAAGGPALNADWNTNAPTWPRLPTRVEGRDPEERLSRF